MDISKIIFRAILAVVVLGAIFVIGLYSGHHRNWLHQMVYGTFDQTRLVIKEIPNLTKSRPIHFLRQARYEGEGVTVNAGPDKTDEYLLLSGFFKDHNGVRLIERDGTIVHEWNVSIFRHRGGSFVLPEPARHRMERHPARHDHRAGWLDHIRL